MNKPNYPARLDEDSLRASLQDILQKIHVEGNFDELDAFRKVFKKTVPLFMRSYVAAYLLRAGGTTGGRAPLGPRKRPTGPMSTLFISIGKNRKVFPRDLVLMLSTTGQLDKGDVGDIKILDNYSFVEVSEAMATSAIQKLDGSTFRGKKLVVNFAKKKEETPRSIPQDDYEDSESSEYDSDDVRETTAEE